MYRFIVLVAFIALRVSAGGDSICNLLKSLASASMVDQFMGEIENLKDDCFHQFGQLSTDFHANSSSKEEFTSAITALSGSCSGDIIEVISDGETMLAGFLGITIDQLKENICFEELYNDVIELVKPYLNSLNSEAESLIDGYN